MSGEPTDVSTDRLHRTPLDGRPDDLTGHRLLSSIRQTRLDPMLRARHFLFVVVAPNALAAQDACAPPGVGVRKVAQWIGDRDPTLRIDTLVRTKQLANIGGTDLGSSFEHRGRLYFLFGDTLPGTAARDTMVYTTATDPGNVTFTFPFVSGNQFRPITVPGVASHGGYCVPSGGVSYRDVIYMVYTNQWYEPARNMERSYMCSSTDDGYMWSNLYVLSQVGANHGMANTHFINVSMSIVAAADSMHLPYPGQDNLLVFGSGAYRKSALYLAAMPANAIGVRSGLRYFAGLPGGIPAWAPTEAAAVPLQTMTGAPIGSTIGEFSAQYVPQLRKWVALYGGVEICMADAPWGPYSQPLLLWHRWINDGYGNFMHVPRTHQPPYDDFGGAADCYAEPDDWGGPYGPYLIPRFTTGNASDCQLYFTLSTWNPYRIILMRAQWPIPQAPVADWAPTRITPWTDPAWLRTPGSWFRTFVRTNTDTGEVATWVTTYRTGDADVGLMWGWLPRDTRNATLNFHVHGGDEEVMLLEGTEAGPPVTGNFASIYADLKAGRYGRVVECTWGPSSNKSDCRTKWDLAGFDRANLKIVIIDKATTPWGFVSVSPLDLTRTP